MIECKLCHKYFRTISHSHLFHKHRSMTQAEYMRDFKVQNIASPETRRIQSKAHMGNTATLGRKFPPEVRRRVSRGVKRRWKDPLFRKKMIGVIRKNWESEETRKKLREIHKKQWADPAFRAKLMEGARKYRQRPGSSREYSRFFKELWTRPSFREKMARRPHRPRASPLTEDQWREAIGWLKVSPKNFGLNSHFWTMRLIKDLIREKWGIGFHSNSIGRQLRKRGCRLVPMFLRELPAHSIPAHGIKKWVGPEN